MAGRVEIEAALSSRDYPRLVALLRDEPEASPLARTRRFAANMIALHGRDPGLASEIEAAPSTGRVRFDVAGDGRPTIVLAGAPAHEPNALCPGGTPTTAEAEARRQLAAQPDPSKSIALAGVGDGRLLSVFAQETPDLVGRQRCVFVVEPDIEVFRAAMMLCDWSGEGDPLRSGRFRLAVGTGWRGRLAADIHPDSRLPPPAQAVRQCVDPREIAAVLRELGEAIRAEVAERRRRIGAIYGPVRPAEIAARLRAVAGARVLLLTTRYSTVLQYSTRDYARALERLDAVARVAIEDEPWEQQMMTVLLGEVERFRPDLVVHIDHHRHESPGMVPDRVPFVCIIQDNLPNLTSRAAGQKMGPTDFAAGSWVHRYALEFGYPPRRCIEIPRLTPVPVEPVGVPAVRAGGDEERGGEVLYVSNHSATAEASVEMCVRTVEKQWADGVKIARAVARDLIEIYADGGCVEDDTDLARMIPVSCSRHGLNPPPPDAVGMLTDALHVHVNNPLYRQQGLAWAVRSAEAMGLGVALHGKGWASHPEFARVARGPIDYRDLPAATAAARFCLVLEPYFPTQHQRALDTWMWNGLALIRRRGRDRQQADFNAWLDRLPAEVSTYADAVAALDGAERSAFEAVYRGQVGLQAWDGSGDMIALYRARERDGIGDLMRLPPRYDGIAFDDEAGMAAAMRRLIDGPGEAEEIRRAQHEWVRERFSYERGARRLLEKIGERMPGA